MIDLLVGADGLDRCGWAGNEPDYVAYHDLEWGRPVTDSVALFEKLSLEAFQSGLSWLTILRKRENFRAAFAGFAPAVVADFDDNDVDRLLADAGIVRNRAKIHATIANAQAVSRLDGGLSALIWGFAPGKRERRWTTLAQVPAHTQESAALTKALKKEGFRFVGPTTAYALMQACGLVDDHLEGCHRSQGLHGSA